MREKVCIIGAGSSGIVAAKTLKEAGIPFDCFEMGSDIGGNWRYDNDNGRSAAYQSLHIDTSKERMAFSDFPMPQEYPNFPHHSHIIRYFEEYVDHFGLRPYITFRTRVDHVAPHPEGGYTVTTSPMDGGLPTKQHYRGVLVCNGHHWNPKIPVFPGEFNGPVQHSRSYRQPEPFRGQKVLVIGIGNSGVDLACDIAPVARQVYLSTRRGAHIIPRTILGRPTDKWVTPLNSRLPLSVTRIFYHLLLQTAVGNQEKYGVPRPPHPILAEHPTMSADLLALSAAGDVIIKPDVAELCGDRVRFADGSMEPMDSIIYATGYQISFPFFDDSFIQFQRNAFPLYRKVVHPDHPSLFFIGLIQPLGAIMPLAELQAKWVAGLLQGNFTLPDPETMQREIVKEQAAIRQRYVDSTRHTIQVDFYPYKRLLEQEMRRYGAQGKRGVGWETAVATAVVGISLAILLRRKS